MIDATRREGVAAEAAAAPALVEFRNVTVLRSGRAALEDLTLEIGVGEHVAILGPNGCGKSTLLKTISRECYPVVRKNSFVRVFGQERWNVFELRTMLGLVSSDLAAACALEAPGREIVLSGFFSSLGLAPHHVVSEAMERKAGEVLALLDAAHLAERPMTEMSSGEARRVLIGRALVHDPKTLVLDEPSASLDLAAQHELRVALRRLASEGIGIVLVTHQLADVIPEIDRVAFMRAGRIVADGPRAALLRPESLSALFGVPIALVERDGIVHAW